MPNTALPLLLLIQFGIGASVTGLKSLQQYVQSVSLEKSAEAIPGSSVLP
jgi:hypothetical protein